MPAITKKPRRLFRSRRHGAPPTTPPVVGAPPSTDGRSHRDLARIAKSLASGRLSHCLLCGGPAVFRVVWTPTASCSKALGAPAGKDRVVAYGLCESCQGRPDATDRAEELILSQAREGLARPESN